MTTATATEPTKTRDAAKKEEIGLALSGGGYRASLFHLGALWRLNELGWLKKLDHITSVSGGSIVAGYLGTRWAEFKWDDDGVATNFESAFVKPMCTLFGTTIDVPTITRGLLNPVGTAKGRVNGKELTDGAIDIIGEAVERVGGRMGRSLATGLARPFGFAFAAGIDASAVAWDALNRFPTPTDLLIKTYDRELFQGRTLQDLPDPTKGNPLFTLYATNMQTGVSVRMNREELSDWKLGKVEKPEIPLAKAVAASSGFPPFYCPVEVEMPLEKWSGGQDLDDLPNRNKLRKRMDLGDGAVYDNLGLTLLEENCETILVSDAGGALDALDALSFEWLGQVIRTLLLSMDQSNKLRFGKLIEDYRDGKKKGVYWSISKKIKARLKDEKKAPELLVDNDKTRAVGEMRTRLNHFTDEEQENLINWGYAIADARMRRWVIDENEKGVKVRAGKLPYSGRLT